MGLLDFISPALTVGTEAAGAQQQAQLQSSLMKRQQEIQALLMQRQFQNQDIENALKRAQTTNAEKQYDPTAQHDIAKAKGSGTVEGETPGLVSREQQMGPVKAANAAATATAENPALIDRAKGIAQATLPTDLTKIDRRVVAQNAGAAMQNAVARRFDQETASLRATVPYYMQAKDAFAEARAGNPAAVKSALVNFAATADPKMQLRQGVMNYVTRIHPGFVGNFEQAVDALLGDKLSKQNVAYMENLVDRVYQTHRSLFDLQRKAFLSRQPLAANFTEGTDEAFPSYGENGLGTPGPQKQPGDITQHLKSNYGIELPQP